MTKTLISALRKLAKERQKRPMRRIVQKSGTSCGVACVAMLSRISYKDGFQLGIACYGKDRWSGGDHGTVNSELRVMLAAVGYKLGNQVACNDWSNVPPGSLSSTKWNQKTGNWHWVVYDEDDVGGFVLDPNPAVKRNKRRDFSKMNVSCYHRVKPDF